MSFKTIQFRDEHDDLVEMQFNSPLTEERTVTMSFYDGSVVVDMQFNRDHVEAFKQLVEFLEAEDEEEEEDDEE